MPCHPDRVRKNYEETPQPKPSLAYLITQAILEAEKRSTDVVK